MAAPDTHYERDDDWARLPDGWTLQDVSGVAVDARDRVYVFARTEHPLMVFEPDGSFVRSFGEGVFQAPHGIEVTPDECLLLTDSNGHAVYKYTLEGRLLLTIGTPGQPAPYLSGRPFNRPTHTAVTPNGDILVADGYGNGRVHRYDPEGRYLTSWGNGTGTQPGQFNVVHNIACDADGVVYIADRENHRIQVFGHDGRYQRQINNLHRPCGLFAARVSRPELYVAEFGPPLAVNRHYQGLGPRVSVLDNDGAPIAQIGGDGPGLEGVHFIAPHTISVDSRHNIFVGEVSHAMWHEAYPDTPRPAALRALRRYRRREGVS